MITRNNIIVITVILTLIVAFVSSVRVEAGDDTRVFFSANDWSGVTLTISGTNESTPQQSIMIVVLITCTDARGATVSYLNLTVSGFSNGTQLKVPLENTWLAVQNKSLILNQPFEFSRNFTVPADVWGALNVDMNLNYNVGADSFLRNESFSATAIRNVYYEKLRQDYADLSQNYSQLNETYASLQKNYTELSNSANQLDGARQLATILGVTTVFFVATTLYLLLRKEQGYV